MSIISRNSVDVIPGDQGTLLYAHGFGCNKGMWSQVLPNFFGRYRQVVFNYTGSSGAGAKDFTVDRYQNLDGYAQDMLDVCEATGLHEGVTLIAHSVSCSIGALAAIKKPDLFRSIIMIGPNPCFLNDGDYRGGFEREDLQELLDIMDRNYLGWADYLAPVISGKDEPTKNAIHDSFCSTDPVTARTFAQATFFADNRADMARLQTPCLILQHRYDALAPMSVGEFMQRQIPRSELRVFDVEGHCAHMSHPELVIEAIESVLAS